MIMIPFEWIYLGNPLTSTKFKWTSSAKLVYALNLNQGCERSGKKENLSQGI